MKGKKSNRMNCLIVEDDRMSREMLSDLCAKIEGLDVRSVDTALNAIADLEGKRYDLVFLDIEMPDMSGIDLMRTQEKMPPVIITSAKKEYAYDAFEFDVVDYLQKPVSLPRLIKAVQKVRKRTIAEPEEKQTKATDHMFIKVDGKHIRLELNEILAITSMRDYVIFQLESERHIVHSTLKSIEEKLESDKRFYKVHRSYMINVNHIVDMDERSVVVGKQVIPISRSNRQAFMEYLNML